MGENERKRKKCQSRKNIFLCKCLLTAYSIHTGAIREKHSDRRVGNIAVIEAAAATAAIATEPLALPPAVDKIGVLLLLLVCFGAFASWPARWILRAVHSYLLISVQCERSTLTDTFLVRAFFSRFTISANSHRSDSFFVANSHREKNP